MKQIISTPRAPKAVGTYSQAVKAGNVVFLSGQIGLVPETGNMISDNVEAQIRQVFQNLQAVIEAAGGTFANVVKLTIYLTDMGNFAKVNELMATFFSEPYPARAAVGVASLPKNALVEMDAILVLGD